jgi:hypothetical protein
VIDRRTALTTLASSLLLYRVTGAGACSAAPKTLEDAAARGRRFLSDLFDPTLGLLPEYKGAKVYWLYHDNYRAAKDRSEGRGATAPGPPQPGDTARPRGLQTYSPVSPSISM